MTVKLFLYMPLKVQEVVAPRISRHSGYLDTQLVLQISGYLDTQFLLQISGYLTHTFFSKFLVTLTHNFKLTCIIANFRLTCIVARIRVYRIPCPSVSIVGQLQSVFRDIIALSSASTFFLWKIEKGILEKGKK
jgi:hypothetical protein